MNTRFASLALCFSLTTLFPASPLKAESLAPLDGKTATANFDELWSSYDPHDNPWFLDTLGARSSLNIIRQHRHAATISLKGGDDWQEVKLSHADFKDANGDPLEDWSDIREFRVLSEDKLETRVNGVKSSLKIGGKWNGPDPTFRKLRWQTAPE